MGVHGLPNYRTLFSLHSLAKLFGIFSYLKPSQNWFKRLLIQKVARYQVASMIRMMGIATSQPNFATAWPECDFMEAKSRWRSRNSSVSCAWDYIVNTINKWHAHNAHTLSSSSLTLTSCPSPEHRRQPRLQLGGLPECLRMSQDSLESVRPGRLIIVAPFLVEQL